MANVRSGNMKVSNMKREIYSRVQELKSMNYGRIANTRGKRQMQQGMNFLDMISKPPYVSCVTVSDLMKKICEQRNNLKARMLALDTNMPGHQFSLFETPQAVSQEKQEEIAKEQMWLKQEIDWLHKCLGMCKNRDYFK